MTSCTDSTLLVHPHVKAFMYHHAGPPRLVKLPPAALPATLHCRKGTVTGSLGCTPPCAIPWPPCDCSCWAWLKPCCFLLQPASCCLTVLSDAIHSLQLRCQRAAFQFEGHEAHPLETRCKTGTNTGVIPVPESCALGSDEACRVATECT